MRCLRCGGKTAVSDSRQTTDAVRRRRLCSKCRLRFTTHERLERPQFLVVKRDKTVVPYNRDKVLGSIELACRKRPISGSNIEAMVNKIERQLMALQRNKIKTTEIGKRVVRELKRIDRVAYLRFVSVYKRFRTLDSFKKELADLQA